jgi:hypothetical protein
MRFRELAVGLIAVLLIAPGCETGGDKRTEGGSSARPPSDTTNAERADAAAADDADRYRAEPQTTTAPARRPPAPRTRRPVDQPRVRP